MRARSLGVFFSILALASCGSDDNISDDDGSNTVLVGVPGVQIDSVSFNQSVQRVLSLGGAPQGSVVPLVTGRTGKLRVFHTTAPEQVGQPVTARLTIEGHEPIEVQSVLSAQSQQPDLNTTINFDVPPEMVVGAFNYRVDLLQEAEEGTADNPTAHHPAEGFEPHAIDIPQNTFRVRMVPFQYNADGSGRVPDLSPESVEIYRQRLMQFYPVSAVEVTVHDPVPWSGSILPNGQGWQEVAFELLSVRAADGMSPDVYYYAIFNPTDSIVQFCGGGCLLGVTLLNNTPEDVGDPALRLALGVGFPEQAYNTNAHELAHAHGRGHAPCGPGLDPQSIDAEYPHSDGGIGVWGWDMFSNQLIDPAITKDVMTYCDPQWISDHNFAKLGNRAKNVNEPKWQAAGIRYRLVSFDAQGKATFRSTVQDNQLSAPPNTPVTVQTAAGERTVMGHYFSFSHMDGGWLFYPEQSEEVLRVTVQADGHTLSAQR